MQRVIRLAADIARCRTAAPCDRKQRCARMQAPIPPMGVVMDGMPPNYLGQYGACGYFVDVDDVMDIAAGQPKAAKPWPKEDA